MTWYQAREYCRSHYTDLVSVRSTFENDEISSYVTENAWIGLHRKPWAWSDSSTSNFTNWHELESSTITGMTSCATASTTTGLWWEADCKELHYFICQNVYYTDYTSTSTGQLKTTRTNTRITTYKLKFMSEEDLNDPDVQQQILKQVQ